MVAWLAALLSGPAFLLGTLGPGIGPLLHGSSLPAVQAIRHVKVAPTSPGRPLFNDPTGTLAQQYRLVRHVTRMVDGTPRGATIHVAAFSFSLPPVAGALIAAEHRGVHVKMVVDDHSRTWPAVRRVVGALGTQVQRDSFVRICHATCRGGRGNQHAKFMTISRTRGMSDVVLVGAMNYTNYAAREQWNDLYTVSDAELYQEFTREFRLMTLDRRQGRLTFRSAGRGLDTEVSPLPDWRPANDPVVRRLERVRCTGVAFGAGRDGRTVIRIAMHAWNGPRGVLLAHRVAGLERRGCDIRVLYGVGMGGAAAQVMRAAGVPVVSSAYHHRHTHEKLMVLSGRYGHQRDANLVWTGSHNWSNASLVNDEITLRVSGRSTVEAYLRNFRSVWRLAAAGNP
ncbi:MAG: phospholipase D-like domain-containing protein [Nocardioidaceae bacterium]